MLFALLLALAMNFLSEGPCRPGIEGSRQMAAAEWSSAAPPGSKRRRADPWRLYKPQSLSRSL